MNPSAPLNHPENWGLFGPPASLVVALESRLATNIGLVTLDGSRQPNIFHICKGKSNPMEQKQRGFVGNASLSLDLLGAHTLLGRADAPEGVTPASERDSGLGHHGASANAVPLRAVFTTPAVVLLSPAGFAVLHLVDINRPAFRATGAIAPTQVFKEPNGGCFISTRHRDIPNHLILALARFGLFLSHAIIVPTGNYGCKRKSRYFQ